jgi:hypothetical protein
MKKLILVSLVILLTQFAPQTNIVNLMYSEEDITKYNQFITWKNKNKEEYKKILEDKKVEVKSENKSPDFFADKLKDNGEQKTKDKQFLYEEVRNMDNEIDSYKHINEVRNQFVMTGFLLIFIMFLVSLINRRA